MCYILLSDIGIFQVEHYWQNLHSALIDSLQGDFGGDTAQTHVELTMNVCLPISAGQYELGRMGWSELENLT